MALMLTIDDAVKIYKRLVEWDGIHEVDEETEDLVRDAFEQKCWLNECDDPAMKQLTDLIVDVNPAEICAQIQNDNLKDWCTTIQVSMQMALVQIRS